MSEQHLGETFDIHGGGLDLIFPHHENEIAQSVCAHRGKPFVNYWLHNGFVTVDGEKMAKSAGNFRTIRDVLADAGGRGEAVRLAMLTGHYRDPFDWTQERLGQATQALDRFYLALRSVADLPVEAVLPADEVIAALEDDLNTPLALTRLHEIVTELNKANTPEKKRALKASLLGSGALLGLLERDPEAWLRGPRSGGLDASAIDELVARRIAARKAKDFAEADRIRDELADQGILLEDSAQGTKWRRSG
jgi:cysteinyl-tRNA synthetase